MLLHRIPEVRAYHQRWRESPREQKETEIGEGRRPPTPGMDTGRRGDKSWSSLCASDTLTGQEGGSKVTRNPHVVSVCPKARSPHVVSDCQPSNPPGPEPAGTNIHYPSTRHQRRVNFKLGVSVKHSVATGGIELGSVSVVVTTSRPLAHHPVVESIVIP
ncbi:hypothetical protein F2Q69_00038431 [Brassica cretica]|uniref:Uncharacterized protein n=1 Tax=Brassica cretica TaxID=69181 RepID=A0A8S9SCP2_BRACR|nr:hypothetical protein F2Q69_00038431 [Brassica cretica]